MVNQRSGCESRVAVQRIVATKQKRCRQAPLKPFARGVLFLFLTQQTSERVYSVVRLDAANFAAIQSAIQSTPSEPGSEAFDVGNEFRLRGCARYAEGDSLAAGGDLSQTTSHTSLQVGKHFEIQRPRRADGSSSRDDANRRNSQVQIVRACAFRSDPRVCTEIFDRSVGIRDSLPSEGR